jgi:hypothetical protein
MPQRLAVGLASVSRYADQAERSRARVAIGSFAAREGYALVEVFDVVGEIVRDEATIAALSSLAARADAAVLLVGGFLPMLRLERLASGTALTVVPVPIGLEATKGS